MALYEKPDCKFDSTQETFLQKSFPVQTAQFAQHAIIISGESRQFLESWPSQFRTLMHIPLENRKNLTGAMNELGMDDVDVYLYMNLPQQGTEADCHQFAWPVAMGNVKMMVLKHWTPAEMLERAHEHGFMLDTKTVPELEEREDGVQVLSEMVQMVLDFEAYLLFNKVKPSGHRYQTVTKLRPDTYFPALDRHILPSIVARQFEPGQSYYVTADYRHDDGYNTDWAIMSSQIADIYFHALEHAHFGPGDERQWIPRNEVMKHAMDKCETCEALALEQVFNEATSIFNLGPVIEKDAKFEYCHRTNTTCDTGFRKFRSEFTDEHGTYAWPKPFTSAKP